MAKRNKSDEIEAINIKAIVPAEYAENARILRPDDFIELLPESLYLGIQPTLAKDHLCWDGFYFLARPLLDLARLWRKEDRIRLSLAIGQNTDGELIQQLIIESGRVGDYTNGGFKYTSKTRLLLTTEEPGYPADIIPLNFGKEPEAAATAPDAWINKARSKEDARPALCKDWGNFAADGFRVHFDASRRPVESYGTVGEYDYLDPTELIKTCNQLAEIALESDHTFSINPKKTIKAIKGLAKLANKGDGRLIISLNRNMDISAKADDYGSAQTSLTPEDGYLYEGAGMIFAINPFYFMDALAGFDNQATIHISSHQAPVYITAEDTTRSALIMLMQLPDEVEPIQVNRAEVEPVQAPEVEPEAVQVEPGRLYPELFQAPEYDPAEYHAWVNKVEGARLVRQAEDLKGRAEDLARLVDGARARVDYNLELATDPGATAKTTAYHEKNIERMEGDIKRALAESEPGILSWAQDWATFAEERQEEPGAGLDVTREYESAESVAALQ